MKSFLTFQKSAIFFCAVILFSCSEIVKQKENKRTEDKFNSNDLRINESYSTKKIHGQVLYLPIYSKVPYSGHTRKYDLSAFVAVHNTDFNQIIKITKVLYFDSNGRLVANYLKEVTELQPLNTTYFFVPETDESGLGANFIVEWVSDSLVCEPLIESVMIGLSSMQGVSFLSTGKIIREIN